MCLDHLVEAHEAVVDVRCGNRRRRLARRRERVFPAVQAFRHRGELDDARAAFQRMKRAKGAVESLGVLRCCLERQQVVGGLVDELP